jgi:Ser/Thr protein kinase RdoA (MazF antagonist)
MRTAQAALPLWGFEGAAITLIAARENAVFRVDQDGHTMALRVHRSGYRTDAELTSELDWMAAVSAAGLSVPNPLPSLSGQHLQVVDGSQVDVLSWLSGETLDRAMPQWGTTARADIFRRLGVEMARLHAASDAWPSADTCARPAWDQAGLLGDAPLWDRFWENPGLTADDRTRLITFRARANAALTAMAGDLDIGLIHADLVPANIMVDGDAMHFIDFDDGGFGYRVFDLATALLKHWAEPDFDTLKGALVAGYMSVRPLNMHALGLFLALRAATYVGWNITRADEDTTGARNARFITQATQQIEAYLQA